MALPASYIQHLRSGPYHPRRPAHSDALAEAVVADLVNSCAKFADAAAAGEVTYDLNFNLEHGAVTWNVDLVLGTPPPGYLPSGTRSIDRVTPATVQIAIELKGVMTEHRKNIKNRKRDLESHHLHVHNYDDQAIAGAILVLNASDTFLSPLRRNGQVTVHRNLDRTLAHCVREVQGITTRSGAHGPGLDAKALLVVEHDNQNLQATRFETAPPAPQTGSSIHYDTFIQRLCSRWRERFGR